MDTVIICVNKQGTKFKNIYRYGHCNYMGAVTGDSRVVTALSLTSLSLKGLNDMKQQSEFN